MHTAIFLEPIVSQAGHVHDKCEPTKNTPELLV